MFWVRTEFHIKPKTLDTIKSGDYTHHFDGGFRGLGERIGKPSQKLLHGTRNLQSKKEFYYLLSVLMSVNYYCFFFLIVKNLIFAGLSLILKLQELPFKVLVVVICSASKNSLHVKKVCVPSSSQCSHCCVPGDIICGQLTP